MIINKKRIKNQTLFSVWFFYLKKYLYLCQMNIENIEKLIEKSEEKINLLKELKDSIIYESKIYNLIDLKTKFYNICTNTYTLYRISDKKELVTGDINIIKSYIRLRNININTIYCKTNALN